MTKKRGRPSKYKVEYIEKLTDYFDRPLFTQIEEQRLFRGKMLSREREIPSDYPTIEGFCLSVGIGKKTFHAWVKRHEEF